MAYDSDYRRARYLKNREQILKKQREYYVAHQEEIKRSANNRYRIKCGLKPIKEV